MKPDKHTIKETHLAVGDGHKLYVQEWGNPKAKHNFIFLHGGPGSGCNDGHKTVFDPAKHRVAFFDQRGSGLSTPKGSLKANDTKHLIDDVSAVADHLNMDSFYLVGGSWGSTLALAYVLENPKRVLGLVLRGIFTARQSETDYIDMGRAADFYPEVWKDFVDSVPLEHRNDPSAYHREKMFAGNATEAKKSAFAYNNLEHYVIQLDDRPPNNDFETYDPSSTIIEQSFLTKGCYLPEGHIIENASKITAPVWIVQGRYDIVCPPITAYQLHQKLPNSQLFMTVAGHSAGDRANWDTTKAILAQI
jgi:proline iminopeptidase